MIKEKMPEVWLRGPVGDICAMLQPVAHALLQAREEIIVLMANFPVDLLWTKPAGLASPAFHLQHIAGVIDRMITYKNSLPLSAKQFKYLQNEGNFSEDIIVDSLLKNLDAAVEEAIAKLKITETHTLVEFRAVGRNQLPSTVGGLLFHMAEHTMRHTGQLLVTVKMLQNQLQLQ